MNAPLVRSLGLLAAAIALAGVTRGSAQETPPAKAPDAPAPFMIAPPAPVPDNPAPAPSQPIVPSVQPAPEPTPSRIVFKPLLPAARVMLEGESDSRNWAFYLTQDDVSANPSLDIAIQNALVVMPEASRLTVRINGEQVLETAIASSDRLARLSTRLRRGLLRVGQNTISFEAVQRHRIDCTVASTYELWTRIDGAGTRLTFANAGAAPRRLQNLDDLPAVGGDEDGLTTIQIVAPSSSRAIAGNAILAVAQALPLRGRYNQTVVQVLDRLPTRVRPGTLTVVLGTSDEVTQLLGDVPNEARARSFVGFVASPKVPSGTLFVTGTGWQDIEAAIATQLTAPVSRPTNMSRRVMETSSWHLPDAPYVSNERRLSFADLGIPTQETSGRRTRTRAIVAFPGDFYASAYGSATLYLDAAYSAEVLPGQSHIELFVNGNVAATVPLNTTTGSLFQRFPISIPLRHFRPGINEIWFEAVTLTKADQACAPGATLPGKSRFALFDSSTLLIPDFAKIGVRPNLAALAGTGFPYSVASRVGLIMGRQDQANFGAAATLLARIAQNASRPLAIETVTSASAVADRPILIVGAAGQLPSGILPRVGIADSVRTTWPGRADAVVVTPDSGGVAVFDAVVNRFQGRPATPESSGGPPPSTDALRNRWRDTLDGSFARHFVSFDQWLQRTFDLSFAQMRLSAAPTTLYEPADGTDLIAAQAVDPETSQVWTAFVARREPTLESTVARIVQPGNWATMGGKITAFRGTQEPHVLSAEDTRFVMTRPFSLANMRLVLANWMSTNILPFAIALLCACVGLGIATSLMLARLGRRS